LEVFYLNKISESVVSEGFPLQSFNFIKAQGHFSNKKVKDNFLKEYFYVKLVSSTLRSTC